MNIPVKLTNGGENPTSGKSQIVITIWTQGQEKFVSDLSNSKTELGDIIPVGSANHEHALQGHDMKISGRWVTQTFMLPAGTLLILQGTRQQHFQDNRPSARLILKIRKHAALRQVEFTTLQRSDSTKGTVDVARGNFDILTLQQAMALGFVPRQHHMPFYVQENVVSMFNTQILEQEVVHADAIQATAVVSADGHSQTVFTRQRRRTI